jgi:hypothetical protein
VNSTRLQRRSLVETLDCYKAASAPRTSKATAQVCAQPRAFSEFRVVLETLLSSLRQTSLQSKFAVRHQELYYVRALPRNFVRRLYDQP